MKKLLIATLGLLATSVYAQPGSGIRNEVGVPPPTVRAEMPRESGPSMPQPGIQRPEQSNPVSSSVGLVPVNTQEQENIARMIALPPTQPAVGATGGAGGTGGNGGLLVGNGGNGATPKPANDAKGPTSVGVDIDYNDIVMRLVPQI